RPSTPQRQPERGAHPPHGGHAGHRRPLRPHGGRPPDRSAIDAVLTRPGTAGQLLSVEHAGPVADMSAVSTGGCIASALTDRSAAEVVGAILGLSAAEQEGVWT